MSEKLENKTVNVGEPFALDGKCVQVVRLTCYGTDNMLPEGYTSSCALCCFSNCTRDNGYCCSCDVPRPCTGRSHHWCVEVDPPDAPTDATMTNAKAKRDPIGVRYDLISPIAMRRLAETYAVGAERYGDRNWEKGLPVSNLANHALNHVFVYLRGDTTEDHLIHAAWNLMAAAHMEEAMPEMIDIPARKEAE